MKSLDALIKMHRFKVDDVRRRIAGLEAMVADFKRQGSELDREVKAEQERQGVSDDAKFAYPSYAHTITTRRNNLLRSIEEIEVQISSERERLAQSYNELKKFEVLEETQLRRHQDEKPRSGRVAHGHAGIVRKQALGD